MLIKDLFIDTISSFGYPVLLQGSMSEDDKYPDNFFTFYNNDTAGGAFYDNKENQTEWDFDLNFYSNDPEKVNTILVQAKALLKDAGFKVDGKGHDVASDEPTHTGRGVTVIYIEREV